MSTILMPSPGTELIKRRPYQIAGLIAGLAVFAVMLSIGGPHWGISPVAWRVAAFAYGLVAAVFG